MAIFNKQEKKVPEDLQSFSLQLIWMTIFVSRGIMRSYYMDNFDATSDCFLIRYKNLLNISTVTETILVEESPLASALLNLGVQSLYIEYIIFKSPMKRIGGNQLGGVYLWVVGSDRIASIILTSLNALSSMDRIGLKVLSNIVFYLSIIIIVVISAFAVYIFDERASQNQYNTSFRWSSQWTSLYNTTPFRRLFSSFTFGITFSFIKLLRYYNLIFRKSLSLTSSSSSLTIKYADNPRDSFEIPYINDYPTYVWAYDLSSHLELLMATYPLKPNIQLNKSVVKPYKTVSDLDQSLMYLQDESFAQSMNVLKFTDSLYASFLRKEEFIHSAELHISYSFFLQDFRPAMQLKLLAQLQKAYEYFLGWTSR
ncbi:MAG: hypothetical protein EZS28_032710 [Streblomastix strix]|uniref:Uncharacterized protein n=1 Tax=Streblomastix strix TaxID=222440 RepID=A0A5J4UNP2_9EUKA|nr:MAG: hypothetical protein EZS28_032710 [Streblomastix strix]